MAATIIKYDTFLKAQMNGGQDTTGASTSSSARVINFVSDTLKVMLVTSAYTPSTSGHAAKSSVTNEVTGGGYTAGGFTLTGKTITLSSGVVVFDADDVVWLQNAAGFTNARYAIVYKDTGTAATSPLFLCMNFGVDQSNVLGDYKVQFDSLGIAGWA